MLQTIFLSLCGGVLGGVVVAFVTPRFGYPIWRKQQRRQQQIALAERFANLGSNLYVITNSKPHPTQGARVSENIAALLEQNSLLVQIYVLFEDKDTLALALRLRTAIDNNTDFQSLHTMRVDLTARLFAEAFEVSAVDIAARAKS